MKPLTKRILYLTASVAVLTLASLIYQVTRVDVYEEEVKGLFKAVKDDIDSLRNLTTSRPVDLKIVHSEFFKRESEEGGNGLKAAREALYKALLLAPATFSIREYEKERAGMIVAAASAYTLYIVKEYFNPNSADAARILAHEYTHILQYDRVKKSNLQTTDSQLAWTAFVEGEADLVADLYTSNKTGRLTVSLPTFTPPKSGEDKWFLDRVTLFPYVYGERFAYILYKAEGWRAIDKAHLNPPTTTFEILHPSFYLNEFKPNTPQNPTPPASGWSIYYPDVLGAYFFNLFITRTLDPQEALRVSSLWLGDNSTLYLNDGGHLLYWQINLHTEDEAKTLKDKLTRSLSEEASTEDGRIIRIKETYITLLTRDAILLVVSSSSHDLAEEALNDLLHRGYN